ncbi:MAG: FAD-dependent oxidoreductase [Terriglobales bacterium]
MPSAVVVGCGVSGLSVGIRLLEAGISTEIWTREPAGTTTSSVAAAFWYPYKALPESLVLGWAATTYEELMRLASVADTGVAVRETMEFFTEPAPDPWWNSAVPRVGRPPRSDLPSKYRDAYLFPSPVAEMPLYLGYLERRFHRMGGTIALRSLRSIQEAVDGHDIVVNCTGLGARELVGDASVVPIRGQIVRVSQVGVNRTLLDLHGREGIAHVVPRARDCILGGTTQSGETGLEPNPATAKAIVARCIELEPRLADAEILEHKVGLRPGRPTVRLEAVPIALGTRLIHNYGHGGAGVALSWGCADEVARLATAPTL